MTQVTDADIYKAAIQWCGEKDRETSMDDIRYFQENWSSLPGLRTRVEAFARQREQAVQEAVAERDARIAELEGKLAHIEAEARRFAGFYGQGSDGRNTFVIFADKIAALQEIDNG